MEAYTLLLMFLGLLACIIPGSYNRTQTNRIIDFICYVPIFGRILNLW